MPQIVAALDLESLRVQAFSRLRKQMGLTGEPVDPCMDPALAYLAPDSIVREIHKDISTMTIGGLASLFIQTLHPAVMAGVDQHSNYRSDPFGRLSRTAHFIGVTTYGTKDDAEAAIARVRRIHDSISGVDALGQEYLASSPHLLGWVHVTEVYCFLRAAERYGPRRLTDAERDAYVKDMAAVARGLGVVDPPRDVASLTETMENYRPELAYTPAVKATRNFLLRGVRHRPHEVVIYSLLAASALGLLPHWTRTELRLPVVPITGRFLVRPAAKSATHAVRLITPTPA